MEVDGEAQSKREAGPDADATAEKAAQEPAKEVVSPEANKTAVAASADPKAEDSAPMETEKKGKEIAVADVKAGENGGSGDQSAAPAKDDKPAAEAGGDAKEANAEPPKPEKPKREPLPPTLRRGLARLHSRIVTGCLERGADVERELTAVLVQFERSNAATITAIRAEMEPLWAPIRDLRCAARAVHWRVPSSALVAHSVHHTGDSDEAMTAKRRRLAQLMQDFTPDEVRAPVSERACALICLPSACRPLAVRADAQRSGRADGQEQRGAAGG
jgi:hypothetical protein